MRQISFRKWIAAPLLALTILISFPMQAHAENKPLRAAFSAYLPPYHFIDESGEYSGLHIDLLNWIAKKKKLDVLYVAYETDGECLRAL
ncbi:MAG: transporter substrate-binding domain-containing protein, partial [Spirochaetia bacterium]|nr:transporter substrate-binding domain-containing protein [Spirochaetia bacterium]